MNPSLKEFKNEYQSRLLDFLWRQWSALGVAGQASPEDQRVVDPEALLLLTCTVGRQDPRLFDEMLDWLQTNGRLVNVMRLKRILRTEAFQAQRVLAAVAGILARGAEAPKWKQLADASKQAAAKEKLFFDDDGRTIPVIGQPEPLFARYGLERGPLRLRGYSRNFVPPPPRPRSYSCVLCSALMFGARSCCTSSLTNPLTLPRSREMRIILNGRCKAPWWI